MAHLGVDRANILPHNPQEKELHRREEENTHDQRRQSQGEAAPEQQFIDKVENGDENAECRRDKAKHGGHTQRHLGVVGDAQHGHIVQGIKVIFGDAALASGLDIF